MEQHTTDLAPTGAAPRRWLQRPDGSTCGDFGFDDQLGCLNLLSAAEVRQGAAEICEGRRFCLSLPLDWSGGNSLNSRRLPLVIRSNLRNGRLTSTTSLRSRPGPATRVTAR